MVGGGRGNPPTITCSGRFPSKPVPGLRVPRCPDLLRVERQLEQLVDALRRRQGSEAVMGVVTTATARGAGTRGHLHLRVR